MNRNQHYNYELHPETIRLLNKGHPWITADRFSKKFPQDIFFLSLEQGIFLHDPKHPQVKARFWAKKKQMSSVHSGIDYTKTLFLQDLKQRLFDSIKKRSIVDRENVYLCFGEADFLPGLFIQYLAGNIFIQYQALFWKEYLSKIQNFLEELLNNGPYKISGKVFEQNTLKETTFPCKEFGICYNIQLKEKTKDIGLFTDMASIRKKIWPYFKQSTSILNLFSYTGAFSLVGLSEKKEMTSVDLSKKYLNYLDDNILLNGFDNSLHKSYCWPVQKYLERNNNEKFDLIICDPPSFSTDGKKSLSAFDFYQRYLPLLFSQLSPKGHLIIFLNTHKINAQKFEKMALDKTKEIQVAQNVKIALKEHLFLDEDCPTIPTFPEGNYLKGLVFLKRP